MEQHDLANVRQLPIVLGTLHAVEGRVTSAADRVPVQDPGCMPDHPRQDGVGDVDGAELALHE
eukprot:8918307-Alexandrium_andersonii.AAC.1